MTDPIPCPKCGLSHARCTAHRRDGQPCQQPPIAGATVCRMLGVDKRELRTDRGAGRTVPVETARAVAQLYKRLVVTPPQLDGSGPSMRGRAIAKGWPPPWAWTERTIDDPGAGPLPYELRPVA